MIIYEQPGMTDSIIDTLEKEIKCPKLSWPLAGMLLLRYDLNEVYTEDQKWCDCLRERP